MELQERQKLTFDARAIAVRPTPPWLWPNLLSLDAPTIAVLWQILIARTCGIAISLSALGLLFLSTWTVYAADRVLDGLRPSTAPPSPRHDFARLHARAFGAAIAAAGCIAVWLAARVPTTLLTAYAILSAAVTAYLWMVHAAPPRLRRYWPKEAAVSIFFAAGIFLPEWSVGLWRSAPMLALLAAVSAVLYLNTRGIDSWERERPDPWFKVSAVAVAIAAIALPPPARQALPISAAFLALLDWRAPRLSRNTVRVLADAALITPLFFR